MQDPPSLDVIRALAQLGGEAEPRTNFETRLIAAALELVQRAETLAPASDVAERERLVALLSDNGDLHQLNRKLCDLIRDGTLTLASPALAAHLRATTMEKLAIDQPTYAAYRRALERSEV